MKTQTASTCPYCGVGCGVLIETTRHADGTESITDVAGDPAHPANFGKLCSKGSTLHLTAQPVLQQQARAMVPLIRASRGEALVPGTWDEANALVADKFAQIIAQHGPDAVGFYISGQLLTEDYYVFNKLAKGLIGTNNIDTNSRLCMSSAVAGYKASLGADAPPCSYEDIDHAQCLFIAGSNTAWAHPILFRRIEEARLKSPELKIVVVDPRRTETAQFADLHLPILPGTDVALFNAMLYQMLWEGWSDTQFVQDHATGFEALRASVRECTPEWAARICGVPAQDIITAARWFSQGPTLSLYCQGLNQATTGTAKNSALINLHLITGQIGKPGAGPFSLTGQPNAMGGREVGGMANLLSGHRAMDNPEHRAEVAALWGIPSVPATPGKTAVEMFDAVKQGQIKAIWIVCTNPAQSMPDLTQVHAALAGAQFVVVQEAYRNTATIAFADVVLPASTWGEKDGTVSNSERRISRVRPAIAPYGQARHDWRIAVDFGKELQRRLGDERELLNYATPESIWTEHRESTRGRDLDITGLSYDMLEQAGPQQWPKPNPDLPGAKRLYTDGIFPTENGRARLIACTYQPSDDKINARRPFMLTTGRLRDQWHCMSRTGLTGRQFAHAPEPVLGMHPGDMARRSIAQGSLVLVKSARGQQYLKVEGDQAVRSGQAFAAMHWGPEFLVGGGANVLTNPRFDPQSKQPELKASAVEIVAAELPFQLSVFGLLGLDRVVQMRDRLRAWLRTELPALEYGVLLPFSSPAPTPQQPAEGLLIRLASSNAFPGNIADTLEELFGVNGKALLRYADQRQGHVRSALVEQGTLQFALLQGNCSSEPWLKQLMQVQQPVQALGSRLLVASTMAPQGFIARGKAICNCMGVEEKQLVSLLHTFPVSEAQACVNHLKERTGCGTSCGSCLPELRSIVAMHLRAKQDEGANATH